MLTRIDSTLPLAKEAFAEVLAHPSRLFEMVRFDLRQLAEKTLSELLKEELRHFLGRAPYERVNKARVKKNHRNGTYQRHYTVKDVGELKIDVPRDRQGEFHSQLIAKYDRYDKALEKDICMMFLSGLSTRGIELMSKTLLGRKISHSEVSHINKELLTGIDAWRCRDLSDLKIQYMYLDGVFFHMRSHHKIERIPMLVIIGVTDTKRRVFLAIQQGDKESATTWREVFKDLKSRGLDKDAVKLGIMDGLSGLMKVFEQEFPSAKIQRCQVHVARNVLAKVPKNQKQQAADHLRDIFYASSRSKALAQFAAFEKAYDATLPSAVGCLKNVINECLSFYSFPQDEWISLRTTNVIERVNKEFKRRTKPMEILAGEASAYRLLCFIALKMELNWRGHPINKPLLNLGFDEFTQLN